MGSEAYQICVTLLKKRNLITNSKLGTKVNICLGRENKSQIWKADEYRKHHKIQKNDPVFVIISCLTYSLIASAFDNFIIFSVERVGRKFSSVITGWNLVRIADDLEGVFFSQLHNFLLALHLNC